MTTTVKISAHLSTDKYVKVSVTEDKTEPQTWELEDGEELEVSAYDGREITVKEVEKQ